MFGTHKILKTSLLVAALALGAFEVLFVFLRPNPLFSSLPTTTTAAFGHAGDPINIALIGDKNAIIGAFLAAHWLVPDPVTASSTVKIAEASVMSAAYPSAPVSNLYLFNRPQDLTFELPTGTVRERHHVRLWKTDETVAERPLWVGTATYDSGIELSGTTALPTHRISPNVDGERDFAAKSLMSNDLVQRMPSERIDYPTFWSSNGGGDWYFDDGLVTILRLQ